MLPLLLAGCGLDWSARGQEDAPAPAGPVLYTAAGSVRTLAAGPGGRVWAATGGGVLCWVSAGAAPRRWTTSDGLSSNDIRAVTVDGDGLLVSTPLGQDRIGVDGTVTHRPPPACSRDRLISDGHQTWAATPQGLVRRNDGHRLDWPGGGTEATVGNVTGLAAEGSSLTLATSLGLWRETSGRWRVLSLPPGSPASHVSALCAGPTGCRVGLYGDGVYQVSDAGQWRRVAGSPAACARPTALMPTAGDGLLVGTSSGGVWRERDGHWQICPSPPALPCADINCLAAFRGALWAGSFDGGLLRITGASAQAVTRAEGMSGESPRGLAVFGGALYARGADGQLDRSADGVCWRPAFAKSDLPRPEVYALAVQDGRRLLVGGWAGWAATDGRVWERHYHDPELEGQVVTALAAQGDAVWIGTQKRGLLRYENGRYTAFQEPQGLTDDWITCLAAQGDRLLVGTYTGGLLERSGERFAVRLRSLAFAIRAIVFDRGGLALAATPLGLYRETAPGHWMPTDGRSSGGLETQAVLPGSGGIWVASRAGLAFVPRHALQGH